MFKFKSHKKIFKFLFSRFFKELRVIYEGLIIWTNFTFQQIRCWEVVILFSRKVIYLVVYVYASIQIYWKNLSSLFSWYPFVRENLKNKIFFEFQVVICCFKYSHENIFLIRDYKKEIVTNIQKLKNTNSSEVISLRVSSKHFYTRSLVIVSVFW